MLGATIYPKQNEQIHIAVVPFAGHLVHNEQPELYTKILEVFFNEGSMIMNLPISFKEKIINCFGTPGEEWLHSLEGNTIKIADDWGLTMESPVTNLSYNYVIHVIDQNNHPFILKMGLPGFDFTNEIRTLQLYNGQGCARLVKADAEQGAMLLEKLQPGTMLSKEDDETVVIQNFCHVWKQIRRPLPKDGEFPTVLDWASAFTKYQNESRC